MALKMFTNVTTPPPPRPDVPPPRAPPPHYPNQPERQLPPSGPGVPSAPDFTHECVPHADSPTLGDDWASNVPPMNFTHPELCSDVGLIRSNGDALLAATGNTRTQLPGEPRGRRQGNAALQVLRVPPGARAASVGSATAAARASGAPRARTQRWRYVHADSHGRGRCGNTPHALDAHGSGGGGAAHRARRQPCRRQRARFRRQWRQAHGTFGPRCGDLGGSTTVRERCSSSTRRRIPHLSIGLSLCPREQVYKRFKLAVVRVAVRLMRVVSLMFVRCVRSQT
jgi:hypothetical protein